MASQKIVQRKIMKPNQDTSYGLPKYLKMKVVENGTTCETKSTTKKSLNESNSIKADKEKAYPKSFRTYIKVSYILCLNMSLEKYYLEVTKQSEF